MWQCTFCYYTSIKKFNVQAHEKLMHSNYNEKTILKNNQNNNEEIKIEEGNIEHVKYNPSIKDEYKVLKWDKIQSRENDVNNMKVQLKKTADLLPSKQKHKFIEDPFTLKIIKEMRNKILQSTKKWCWYYKSSKDS